MMRRLAIMLALAAALFLMVAPALAGGWAVITLDALPPAELNTGEPLTLGFMVRQHGQTPVHAVDFLQNQPVVPVLTAVNRATGETLRVEAAPDEELGHFTAQITLPSAGEWSLSLSPEPLEGDLALEPVRVGAAAPAVRAPASESATLAVSGNGGVPLQTALRTAGLVLLALAAVMAVAAVVERRKPAVAEAGD